MKIAIVSSRPEHLGPINTALDAQRGRHQLESFAQPSTALESVLARAQPDLLVMDLPGHSPAELAPLEQALTTRSSMAVIVVCAHPAPEFLMRAMQAGVGEVLPAPADPDALGAAIRRAERRLGGTSGQATAGTVLTLVSCKGGCGATFLATNLAAMLAERGRRVMLIDFNLQFGDAVHYMQDAPPTTDIADLSHDIARLDAALLKASLQQVSPGFGVLAAPEDPAKAAAVRPEHVDPLIDLARSEHDFVIIDLGRSLDPVTLKVLDRSDRIYPVMQAMLPGVRNARRMLRLFHALGYPEERIEVLVNRYEKGGAIEIAELQRAIGAAHVRTIPNSFGPVSDAIAQGLPIGQIARGGNVTRTLMDLATTLLPGSPGTRGWLGRMLRRA